MKPQDSLRQAFINGWTDRAEHGLLRVEQLYRRPLSRRIAWRLGWELANQIVATPLRTQRKKPQNRSRLARTP